MPERNSIPELPSERQQVVNFARARRKLSEASYKPHLMQKGILLGLMTVLPVEVKASGILNNPKKMAVVDALVAYQVRVNDRLDFEGSGRNDLAEITKESKQVETDYRQKLEHTLSGLSEQERGKTMEIIDSSLREVEAVELWIREKRDNSDLNFSTVDIYRNIVNAISNVSITAIMLGPERFSSHLNPIPADQLNIQAVLDKYAWVFGNHPATSAEQAVMIMHNVAMVSQIIDDMYGDDIDKLLNIPTYFSAALAMTGGDRNTAKRFLNQEADRYKEKAHELGLGKLAIKAPMVFMSAMERMNMSITRRARSNKSLRGLMIKHYPNQYLREKRFIEGKLDAKPPPIK